jgi:HK97 family phage portal protein
MSFLDIFKNFTVKAASPAIRSFPFIPEWIKVSWMDTDFMTLTQRGYKASSAVANCVRALAFSFPEPPLVAYRGDKPAGVNDPLQKLIRQPNPDMGEAELMQFVITYAAIGGNVYLWKERNQSGQVIALWPFSDKDVMPQPGHQNSEGFVRGYEFNVGDGQKVYLPKSEVIQWKWMIDPEQPWRGIGAIEFAARDVQSDTESSRYTYAMFKNNAIPPVVVTLVEGDELTEEKHDRLVAAWMKKYGGENTGVPAFLESGMKVVKLGWNMQELNVSELKNIPESRICGAFGVPPSIAMLYVGLKRSDYGDGNARKSFTETTLVALWRTFSSEMSTSLSDDFGGGYELRFDLNKVRALQENLNELWTRLSSAADKGLITRAEFRRGVGYEAGVSDEVYRTNMINGWEAAKGTPGNPADTSGKFLTLPSPHSDALSGLGEETSESKSLVYGRALQRIRRTVWPEMAKELDSYFASLSDRVVSRAGKGMAIQGLKGLPSADDLLTPKDEKDLVDLLKKWFIGIAQASWETINLSLGVSVDFELTDPAITKMLATAGGDVMEITKTTRTALQQALQYGNEQGWSVGQLVRGDENQAGIRSIVEETYKNRSLTIARTELGNAQNAVTAERYKTSGVERVEILDNGNDDDDEACQVANGQIWTLEIFESNKLEHPNCTRCAAPYFGEKEPDRS